MSCINHMKDFRISARLTQHDMASFLSVGKYTYAEWERGKNKVPDHIVAKLSLLYGVDSDYIVSEVPCELPSEMLYLSAFHASCFFIGTYLNPDSNRNTLLKIRDISSSLTKKVDICLLMQETESHINEASDLSADDLSSRFQSIIKMD